MRGYNLSDKPKNVADYYVSYYTTSYFTYELLFICKIYIISCIHFKRETMKLTCFADEFLDH